MSMSVNPRQIANAIKTMPASSLVSGGQLKVDLKSLNCSSCSKGNNLDKKA